MTRPELPIWPRILLSILTILAFLPQFHRICSTKNSSAISVYYVLLNLIVATQQFTFLLILAVGSAGEWGGLSHNPYTVGDGLNFVQITLVFILFLILFVLTVQYSRQRNGIHVRRVRIMYLGFLAISVIPLPLFLVIGYSPKENFGPFFFAVYHLVCLNPLTTILGLSSVLLQAKRILRRKQPQHDEQEGEEEDKSPGLRLRDLAAQAVVFAALAVSWIWRTAPRGEDYPPNKPNALASVLEWYLNGSGWVILSNAAFAMVQFVLLGLSLYVRHMKRDLDLHEESEGESGETEPLLGQQRSAGEANPIA